MREKGGRIKADKTLRMRGAVRYVEGSSHAEKGRGTPRRQLKEERERTSKNSRRRNQKKGEEEEERD